MNFGTFFVLVITAAIVAFAIRSLIVRGKGGCSCGCEGCSGVAKGNASCARGQSARGDSSHEMTENRSFAIDARKDEM
ncbi:MAG: FeoB-associated Cys-rich membrane protein [Clostridiales Family XIII bacterium]|jgi:hypothetical protein|nr:FeoB-associated Cys-rich membrane protein [Clostridiales Family XIII bacterium]